jgi:hypothetical protein
MIDEFKLPENTVLDVANKVNTIIEQIGRGEMSIPIDGDFATGKGILKLTFPPNSEIGIELIIPFENNLKNKDISLKDSLAILYEVDLKLMISQVTKGICEKHGRGPSIVMTGTKSVSRQK